MSEHDTLLATPRELEGVRRMMQYVEPCYINYINQNYGSGGSI